MESTRAYRRRAIKADAKKADYAESGFRDNSTYRCAVDLAPRRGFDASGNPNPDAPFTSAELMGRAVRRRDERRMIDNLIADQTKASKEADIARRQAKKTRARLVYLAAFQKPQPVKYLHSAARGRLAPPELAMAA